MQDEKSGNGAGPGLFLLAWFGGRAGRKEFETGRGI